MTSLAGSPPYPFSNRASSSERVLPTLAFWMAALSLRDSLLEDSFALNGSFSQEGDRIFGWYKRMMSKAVGVEVRFAFINFYCRAGEVGVTTIIYFVVGPARFSHAV